MRSVRTNQGLQRRVLGCLWAAALMLPAGGVTFAQERAPGRIIGHIDGARYGDGGYVGKIVNGVDTNVVIGAYRFPGNAALAELDAAAKESASIGPFSLEPILYGKWRD